MICAAGSHSSTTIAGGAWTLPIRSLPIPLVVAEHDHAEIEPWLWGPLPDNEAILARWGQRFHVSPRNAFALLGAVGEDCHGAVQLVRAERQASCPRARPPEMPGMRRPAQAASEAVVDEWLFAWPRGCVQTWFERSGERYEFGQKLQGPKDTWKETTRSDALFLSTAVTLNSEQLKPISDRFLKTLHIAQVGGWSEALTTARCRESSQTDGVCKQDILDFLNRSDLSIKGIRVDDREFTADRIPGELPPSEREEMKKNLVGKKIPEITLVHDIGNHQDFELDIRLESHGTQRIFALAGPWLDVLKRGSIIVIDELEQGLHPALVGFLIDCFHNPALNRKDAQLVFTTHNTSILSQDTFRRDQIWFCERNRTQEARLFPLTRFHPREKYENLERSYLSGRYGALPHLRSFDETVR